MEISQVWLDLADMGIMLRQPPVDTPRDHTDPTFGQAGDRSVDIMLEGPNWPLARYHLTTLNDPLRPALLNNLALHMEGALRQQSSQIGLLVLASTATDSTVLRAARLGISVLTVPKGPGDRSAGILVHPESHLMLAVGHEAHPTKPVRPGRPPWATFAVAIGLLEAPAASQADLADRCGITQGRVSAILRTLEAYTTRGPGGIAVTDALELAQWLAQEYPRRSKMSTAWLTLEPLVPMAARVAEGLADTLAPYAFSGDVAADLLVPWANPTILRVHTTGPLDMARFGSTPAPMDVANVIVDVPVDPYALSTRWRHDGLWLASPWRIWLDLVADGRDDAADALRGHLIRRIQT